MFMNTKITTLLPPIDLSLARPSVLKIFIAYCALLIFIAINSPIAFGQTGSCVAEQGTWSNLDTNQPVFTPGTSSTDDDVGINCTGDLTDITDEILETAIDEIDSFDDFFHSNSKIGVYVNVTNDLTTVSGTIHSDTKQLILFAGDVVTETTNDGFAVIVEPENEVDSADPPVYTKNDWRIDNYLNVTASGNGKRGIAIFNSSGGGVTFRNFADITTTGEGFTRPSTRMYRTRTAHGITVSSESDNSTGDVMVINEAEGSVTTQGDGARGILAYTEGTGDATVINRGEVSTSGDVYKSDDSNADFPYRTPDGIFASSDGGNARAENENIVTTSGDGARAVYAYTGGAGKTAVAKNRGTVTVSGNKYRDGLREIGAYGVAAITDDGSSFATNESTGTITISGVDSEAVLAYSDFSTTAGQTVVATNQGTISGTSSALEASGLVAAGGTAGENGSSVHAENSGYITMEGSGSFGIFAGFVIFDDGSSTGLQNSPGSVSVNNSGNVIVSGDRLPSATELANIHSGIYAGFYDEDKSDTDEFGNTGNVSVVHTGKIEVKNGIGINTEVFGSGNSKVEVKDGATIEAGKAEDTPNNIDASWGMGIYSRAVVDSTTDDVADDDDIHIVISGEDTAVTAHSDDDDDDATTDVDESESIGIKAEMIETREANMPVTAHAKVEVLDGATVTADKAVVFEGGRGTLNVTNSTIVGDVEFHAGDFDDMFSLAGGNVEGNINFYDGDDVFDIRSGLVKGNIDFGDGDDTLNLRIWGRIDGDLDFGLGDDHLYLDVLNTYGPSVITGNIFGIETMTKRCPGDVRIEGEVDFAASTLSLEEGGLIVAGVVDLMGGEVIIHDETKLTFEIGDIINDPLNYGRFEDASAIFKQDADPEIHTQLAASLVDNNRTGAVREKLNNDSDPPTITFVDGGFKQENSQGQEDDVEVMVMTTDTESGTTRRVGTVDSSTDNFTTCGDTAAADCSEIEVADEVEERTEAPTVSTVSTVSTSDRSPSGGSSSNRGSLLGVGLIAALFYLWDFDFFGEDSADEYAYDILSLQGGSVRPTDDILPGLGNISRVRWDNGQYWLRSLAENKSNLPLGTHAKVQGAEFGVKYNLGDGFSLNGSFVPEFSASIPGSQLKGHVLQVGGNWSNGNFFTGLKISYENHDTTLITANPVINSSFKGNSTLTNTHLQFQTGTMMNYGSMEAKTMLSMFTGSMKQGAYLAESPVMTADIPELSQRYTGWNFGLNLKSSEMIETSNGTRVLPSLTMNTMRTTTTGIESMFITQSDRIGALSFRTNSGVRELPRTINMLGLSSDIKRSSNSGWRVGYMGAEIDGEFENYALARFSMKF